MRIEGFLGANICFHPSVFGGADKFLIWTDDDGHEMTGPIVRNSSCSRGYSVGGRGLEYVLDEAVSFSLLTIIGYGYGSVSSVININEGNIASNLLSDIEFDGYRKPVV